ncbi:ADP-ribosylation factor-like protein 6-interacting protein 1 [Condylostylus longicornis]|uniref:ADP-ribosylation factor-like protein 6-interacting protein 1 n=1 Tax=Condylostylus longicornis TaxID=2530218 RepID=UPI00244DCA9E|nr:ADP-ribosylation factor-like protein 6-interacting protein 1 [Condylostylus longicornis]
MTSVDQKRAFNKLKHDLENWRELILLCNSVLKWEKPFYPGIIFGGISVTFLILWWLDLSVLTLICSLALKTVLFDYFYPMISKFIFKPESWTGAQESKFEDVCNELCVIKDKINSLSEILFNAKQEKSTLFVIAVSAALLFGAYIGSVIDNLLLAYIAILGLGFYPGLQQQGYVGKAMAQISALVAAKLQKIKEKSNKTE